MLFSVEAETQNAETTISWGSWSFVTHTQTHGCTDTQTHGHTDPETQRHTHRHTNTHAGRQTHRRGYADRHTLEQVFPHWVEGKL